MKLIAKLTLFNTFSKLAIVLLFVLLLPVLINNIVSQFNNQYLRQQKDKVLKQIERNGIDYYLEGQESYGSYTMLKEEYISLEPDINASFRDTIETNLRVVEDDTLNYRVLRHVIYEGKNRYVLEIGKATATIGEYSQPLQKLALSVLIGLILLTTLFDLVYTRVLLKPLDAIISSRIVNAKFPFREAGVPVKTSTSDFIYLDRCLVDLMTKIKDAFDKEREFTSNASHELMTPIAILQNKLENVMVENDVTAEMQEKILAMMNTLSRLKKIVRSLLLISRIENDQYTKKETVNMSVLINEVLEELDDRIEAKRLSIDLSVSPQLPVRDINRDLIFQLFYNLINNAIRYNIEGGSIRIAAEKKLPGGCVVIIEDTGIGIKEEDIGSIFNRFKKSHGSAEEGYGLGLSIVKSIADYHSLHIEVSSVPGKGTTFGISFPNA